MKGGGEGMLRRERRREKAMIRRSCLLVLLPTLLFVGVTSAQQYPLLDMIANKVIQKYQQSSFEQLWKQKGEPKLDREKEGMQLLRDDPQMRAAFIDRVAAPIASKMFECGMFP
jgi:hypothetical protein